MYSIISISYNVYLFIVTPFAKTFVQNVAKSTSFRKALRTTCAHAWRAMYRTSQSVSIYFIYFFYLLNIMRPFATPFAGPFVQHAAIHGVQDTAHRNPQPDNAPR